MLTYRVEKELLLKPFEINERIAEVKSEIFRKGDDKKHAESVKILKGKLKTLERDRQTAIDGVKETDSNYLYPQKTVSALMTAIEFQDFDKDEYLNALHALGVVAV